MWCYYEKHLITVLRPYTKYSNVRAFSIVANLILEKLRQKIKFWLAGAETWHDIIFCDYVAKIFKILENGTHLNLKSVKLLLWILLGEGRGPSKSKNPPSTWLFWIAQRNFFLTDSVWTGIRNHSTIWNFIKMCSKTK